MGAFRAVLGIPDIRRLDSGWALSLTGGFVSTVAMFVYAYAEGGVALVAGYGLLRTLPAAVVTPLVINRADHVRPDRLLRRITGTRGALVALAAAAAAADASPVLVVAFAAVSSALSATFRPIRLAALPWLARTPAELSAAGIVGTMSENAAALAGPAVAGVVLMLGTPSLALAVAAGCLFLATVAMWRLTVPTESTGAHDRTARQALRDAAAGATALAGIAPPLGFVVMLFAQTFVRGALLVLVVLLAVDVLALGEGAVGWLNAVMGVGGLLGGVVSAAVVRLTRLGRCFVAGVALWGLPLLALAAMPTPVVAYAALFVVGLGNVVEDAGGYTLLARLLRPRLAARALSVLEPIVFLGIGTGSSVAPLLIEWLGVRQTLAVVGLLPVLLAAAYLFRFVQIDRTMPQPGPEIDILRRLTMFSMLPLVAVEQLAAALERRDHPPGEAVVHEGAAADRFYVITDGRADVSVRGHARPSLGPGDCFGEIALLHDVPRTATITADIQLQTLSLGRDEFLAAVTANRLSAASADELAGRRLAADPPATH